jgi:hypothetical protein
MYVCVYAFVPLCDHVTVGCGLHGLTHSHKGISMESWNPQWIPLREHFCRLGYILHGYRESFLGKPITWTGYFFRWHWHFLLTCPAHWSCLQKPHFPIGGCLCCPGPRLCTQWHCRKECVWAHRPQKGKMNNLTNHMLQPANASHFESFMECVYGRSAVAWHDVLQKQMFLGILDASILGVGCCSQTTTKLGAHSQPLQSQGWFEIGENWQARLLELCF